MAEFFDVLYNRRSIRLYKDEPVPRETIEQLLVDAGRGARLGGHLLVAELEVLHERVEVLAQDLRRFDERLLRRHRPVRPDVDDQPVVVGPVADTRILDAVTDPLHGAEHRIDRDLADDLFLAIDILLACRLVTASL